MNCVLARRFPGDLILHSHCAGFTAGSVAALVFAALPRSSGVIRRVVSGQASLVAAADLAQDLQPLAGLHAVSCLNVERLL